MLETPLASPGRGIGPEAFRKVSEEHWPGVCRMGKLRHGAAFPRLGPGGVARPSSAPVHRYEGKHPSGKKAGEKDTYLGGLKSSSGFPGICPGGQPTGSPRPAAARPALSPGQLAAHRPQSRAEAGGGGRRTGDQALAFAFPPLALNTTALLSAERSPLMDNDLRCAAASHSSDKGCFYY